MESDFLLDYDCPCTEPDHMISSSRIERGLYFSPREREIYLARARSRPLPGGSILEDIRFYSRKDTIKEKYRLFMFALEEKFPAVYKALTSIGFPDPW